MAMISEQAQPQRINRQPGAGGLRNSRKAVAVAPNRKATQNTQAIPLVGQDSDPGKKKYVRIGILTHEELLLIFLLIHHLDEHVIDQAELLGLLGREIAIAFRLFLDLIDGAPRVLGQDLV